MNDAMTRRFKKTWQVKQLGSRERVGRYARKQALEQVESFVRHNWKVLLVALFLPLVGSLLISLQMAGISRWIFVGVFGSSGPWVVAILIILFTGVGNTLMGLDSENSTAGILRKFRSAGWILVNGVKIKKNADIDHVLIGPAGVVVIESKWSHHRWPVDSQVTTFMTGALSRSVSQVLRNRDDIQRKFVKDLADVPVKAICVLWSSEYSADDPLWFEHGQVTVIQGPALKSWLESLSEVSLDPLRVEHVSNVIGKQTLNHDDYEFTKSGPPPRTFRKFVLDTVIAPSAGFMLVVYGFVLIGLAQQLWLYAFALFAFALIGFVMRRFSYLRGIAIGLLLGDAICFLVVAITLVRAFFR